MNRRVEVPNNQTFQKPAIHSDYEKRSHSHPSSIFFEWVLLSTFMGIRQFLVQGRFL